MKQKLVVISDTQAPYHLPQAVSLACAFIRDYKPDTIVLNGDMIDFVSVSSFSKSGRLSPRTVLQEIAICLTEVIFPVLEAAGTKVHWVAEKLEGPVFGDAAIKIRIKGFEAKRNTKFIWIEGNHEYRLSRYVMNLAAALDGLVEFEDVLGLKQLGIQWVPGRGTSGNGIYALNKNLYVMHGERSGINAARQTLLDLGASVLLGHGHQESSARITWNLVGRDIVALVSGCLCQEPDFKSTSKYNRGLLAGWYDDTRFAVDHVRIVEQNHTRLVSPWGEYEAKRKGDGWQSKRID